VRFLTGGESSPNGIIGLDFVLERSVNEDATTGIAPATKSVAESRCSLSANGKRITNIYDYADHPIDCLKGTHEKTGFALRLYPKGWGVYTGAVQHVSKRNVFAMLDWLHEQQAKPLKNLFKKQEVLHDPNRSYNVGL